MPEFAKQLYKERPEEIALRFENKTMNWSDIDLTCLLYTSPSPRD